MNSKVVTEAIRQALKLFSKGGGSGEAAKGAEKVLEVAIKVARKGK